jgi:hypothetical protein
MDMELASSALREVNRPTDIISNQVKQIKGKVDRSVD